VRGIDQVYDAHREREVEIVEELATRPWGVRQYVVREPNGYHLKVAEPFEPEESA